MDFHGALLLAAGMGWWGHCTTTRGYSYFTLHPRAICLCQEMICSEILVLFYSAPDLPSQSSSSSGFEMWMWMSVWAAPSGHVCVLTFSLPCFPVSPLSMIHRFLRPFSLHPIDGFQSYLNFKVLMRCSSGQRSALLTYRLYKVTIREGGKKSQSIYQDVLLYFFYPSQRRWFYFSENPLNSDQVRWLLSLETQELSHHNRYKWTLKRGAWGRLMVFSEFFFFCCFLNTTKSFYLSDFKLRTLGFCYTSTVDSIIDDLTGTMQLNVFLPVRPLPHTSRLVWIPDKHNNSPQSYSDSGHLLWYTFILFVMHF